MMSRIDVVPVSKNSRKFKVLVNFLQRGSEYCSAQIANEQAKKVHKEMPALTLHLAQE